MTDESAVIRDDDTGDFRDAAGPVTDFPSTSGGPPSGAAGGALDGTYPNPGIAAAVAGNGLSESSNVLAVNVDGSTVEISSDALRVKADGITANEIAAGAVGASELAATAVTAGTYGDATHSPQIAIDADGRITSASDVPISGGGGGIGAVLFDSTLGADTASIDTGAGGIAGGYHVIVCYITARTDEAAAVVNLDVTFNNDTGNNYDLENLQGNNTTVTGAASVAQPSLKVIAHGSGGSASYPGTVVLTIPNYGGTTFFKSGSYMDAAVDATVGNNFVRPRAMGYRSTTAISRMKVAAVGAAKLKAGTRLTIIGW